MNENPIWRHLEIVEKSEVAEEFWEDLPPEPPFSREVVA